MTEDIFDMYTARDFFDWIDKEDASEYIKEEIGEIDGESIIYETFDVAPFIEGRIILSLLTSKRSASGGSLLGTL